MPQNRRNFIKTATLAATGLTLPLNASILNIPSGDKFVSKRPPLEKRKFTSKAVEATIKLVKKNIKDPEIAWLFENCYPNTLDTTVVTSVNDGKPDTLF